MIFTYSLGKMAKLFTNSEDPDQTRRLHWLPVTLLRVSRLQWLNQKRDILLFVCFKVADETNIALNITGNKYR